MALRDASVMAVHLERTTFLSLGANLITFSTALSVMFEHCVKSRILSLSKHNWAPVLDSKHSYVMFEFLEILNSFKNSSVENRLCKDSFVTFSQPCRSISTRFGHRLTSSLTTSSSTLLQSLNLTRFNSGQL